MPPSAILDADLSADGKSYFVVEEGTIWRASGYGGGGASWQALQAAADLPGTNGKFMAVRCSEQHAGIAYVLAIAKKSADWMTYCGRTTNSGNTWSWNEVDTQVLGPSTTKKWNFGGGPDGWVGEVADDAGDPIASYGWNYAPTCAKNGGIQIDVSRPNGGFGLSSLACGPVGPNYYASGAGKWAWYPAAEDEIYVQEGATFTLDGEILFINRIIVSSGWLGASIIFTDSSVCYGQLMGAGDGAAAARATVTLTVGSGFNGKKVAKFSIIGAGRGDINLAYSATATGFTFKGTFPAALACARTNDNYVYVGTQQGIYRSVNGGFDWEALTTDYGGNDLMADWEVPGAVYFWNTNGALGYFTNTTETLLSPTETPSQDTRRIGKWGGDLYLATGGAVKKLSMGSLSTLKSGLSAPRGMKVYQTTPAKVALVDDVNIYYSPDYGATWADKKGGWADLAGAKTVHLLS